MDHEPPIEDDPLVLARRLRQDPAFARDFVFHHRLSVRARRHPMPASAPRRRPRRRWLHAAMLAAGLAAMVLIGIAFGSAMSGETPPPEDRIIDGQILVDGQPQSALPLDRPFTSPDRPLEIAWKDGGNATIAAGSELTLRKADQGRTTAIELRKGGVSLRPLGEDRRFRIKTPVAQIKTISSHVTIDFLPERRRLDITVAYGTAQVEGQGDTMTLMQGESRSIFDQQHAQRQGALVRVFDDGRRLMAKLAAGTEELFELRPDIRVLIDGRPARIDALTAGCQLRLTLDEDGRIEALTASGQTLTAKVRAVPVGDDPSHLELTIGSQPPITLPIDPLANLYDHGTQVPWSNLRVGTKLKIALTSDASAIWEATVVHPPRR